MTILYNIALFISFILFLPYFLYQILTTHKYKEGTLCRLSGNIFAGCHVPKQGKILLIHAVSVGEIQAAGPLIEKALTTWPHHIVVTTTTKTAQDLARQKYLHHPRVSVTYFPFDFPWASSRFLNILNPDMILIMETEIWPNFLNTASKKHIPVFLVNGRISPRAFKRYRLIRWGLKKYLSLFRALFMQTDDDRERILSMGAPAERTTVIGNIKFDYTPPETLELASRRWMTHLGITKGQKILIAASTHKGEESLFLRAFSDIEQKCLSHDIVLLIAPRHPERIDSVVNDVKNSVYRSQFTLLSELKTFDKDKRPKVIIIDKLGILSSLFSIADIVIMGGSFVPVGGHNILEPSAYGRITICGPHMENFQEIFNLFSRHDALVSVKDRFELVDRAHDILMNNAAQSKIGERALRLLSQNQGATSKTMEAIQSWLRASPEARA